MNLYTVSEINRIVKNDLESDPNLKMFQVNGEISNFVAHNTGHFYFSLKDETSQIRCVMFSSNAIKVKFKIENGLKVTLTCGLGVFQNQGTYQLYVYNIDPIGIGSLFLQFEQLKEKLLKNGYFDQDHKKLLPKYPNNIGVISSKEGAAIRDVITTIKRRWPIANITLIPSLVQGKDATKALVNAIRFADTLNFDVLIITRGGGSIEDLWCFNEEEVAIECYNLKTPFISAVGHEIDTTIIDYISDKRAATPTAAAEIVTPNIIELENTLSNYKKIIIQNFQYILNNFKNKVENLKDNRYLTNIENLYADKFDKINLLKQRLISNKNDLYYQIKTRLNDQKTKLININQQILLKDKNLLKNYVIKLDALSPLKTMSRGYGIVSQNNNIISSIKELDENELFDVQLVDGHIVGIIKEIKGD